MVKIDTLFKEQKQTNIKLQEKGVKFYLRNPDTQNIQVSLAKGEETTEKDGQERCDYIAKAKKLEETEVAYVELKGNHINKAISQIETTHRALNNQLKADKWKAFVVSNKRLPKTSSKEQKNKDIFRKKYYIRLDFCKSESSYTLFSV